MPGDRNHNILIRNANNLEYPQFQLYSDAGILIAKRFFGQRLDWAQIWIYFRRSSMNLIEVGSFKDCNQLVSLITSVTLWFTFASGVQTKMCPLRVTEFCADSLNPSPQTMSTTLLDRSMWTRNAT